MSEAYLNRLELEVEKVSKDFVEGRITSQQLTKDLKMYAKIRKTILQNEVVFSRTLNKGT